MPAGPHLSPVVGGGGQAELLHHERQVDGHIRDQLVLGPEGLLALPRLAPLPLWAGLT